MKINPWGQKGVTFLELSITIIIVAFLFGAAFYYYTGAIENARMTEIVTLMNAEVAAQQRHKATKNRYTYSWHQLDAQPAQVRNASAKNKFANGMKNTIYYSRGKDAAGNPNSGFEVYFEDKGVNWFVVAKRVGHKDYTYTLVRPFQGLRAYCIPAKDNKKDQKICMHFMGVDTLRKLPADPR